MRFRFFLPMMLVAAGLSAQTVEDQGRFRWLQIQAAGSSQSNADCVQDGALMGLGLGRWEDRTWGWEFAIQTGTLSSTASLWKARETHLNPSLLFSPFGTFGPWRPFVRGSVGLSQVETPLSLTSGTGIRPNFLFGAGVQGLFGDHFLASTEVRQNTVLTKVKRNELEVLVGLGIRWGNRAAEPTPRPLAVAPAPAPIVAPAPVLPPAPKPEPVVKVAPKLEVAPAPVPPPVPKPDPVVKVAPKVDATPASVAVPTPAPAPVPAPKVAPAAPQGVLLEGVVHFAVNSSRPGPGSKALIRRLVAALQLRASNAPVRVEGFTCALGPKVYNRALSLRRAQRVADLLQAEGVDASRLRVSASGSERPAQNNGTRRGRAANRRAEVTFKADILPEGSSREETPLVFGPRTSAKHP